MRALVLSILSLALTAAELRLHQHDPLVRPGTAFALSVTRDPGPASPGERVLTIALLDGDHPVAAERIHLATAYQLDRPLRCFVAIPADLRATDLQCELRLEGGAGAPAELAFELPTWLGVMQRLATMSRRLGTAGSDHPLPTLWLEQAQLAARAGGDLATIARIIDRCDRIEAWLAGERDHAPQPGERVESALRCAVDTSVQPLRISLPPGEIRAVVECLIEPEREARKDAWTTLPEAWYQAAAEHGLALVEWYPAGDRNWSGIAATRHRLAADAVLTRHGLEQAPRILLGRGSGALAALRAAARRPHRYAALALIDPTSPPPSPNADLPHELATWFDARRSIVTAAGALGNMAVATSGPMPPAWAAIRRGEVDRAARVETAELWQWLAAIAGLPPRAALARGRWRAPVPGRYGPLEILALERWGETASVELEAGYLTGAGIAAWRWLGPGPEPAVSGEAPPLGAPVPGDQTRVLGHALGPVDGYAEGPFAVVIGRSGDLASNERNRLLAQAFLDDWVEHAQGAPPWCFDDQDPAVRFPAHHLICIGSTRSNRVVAGVADGLPLRWDVRGLTVGQRRYRDGEHLAVAVCRPRPGHEDRLLVVLDGAPGWSRGDGLPLRDWPDLAIDPLPGYRDLGQTPDPTWRLADTSWSFDAD